MNLDFQSISPALHLAELVVILLLWLRKPGEDAEKKFISLSARVDVLDERVKHVPTSDELTELRGTVRAVSAELTGLRDFLDRTSQALVRVEIFMRDHL